MRILEQAIEEKLYEGSDDILVGGHWSGFENLAKNKPVFLFGTGEGADYVLQKYSNIIDIFGAFDNDSSKWGHRLKEYISCSLSGDIKIYSPSYLNEIKGDYVVLITSVRYCDDIFEQLKGLGVINIFSLLHMEANKRIVEGYIYENINERSEYANACLSLPIEPKKIILARDGLAGHGKQIYLQLLKKRTDLDLVWIVENDNVEKIPGIRIVLQSDWKGYIRELETASIWIFGDMIPEYAIKRSEQVYIHVKHWASITLKSFYFHLKKHLATKSVYDYYRHNTEAMDYCMVGSDFDEETCKTGFDFNGSFIRVGSPRSDVLFDDGMKEQLYGKIGIRPEVHTVIYAPTFRSKNYNSLIGHMRNVDLDFETLKKTLEAKFGGEWMVLLRIHPDVAMESSKVPSNDFIYDVSHYPDSEELVVVSDIMISDYSSIMFEPAFVGKPVFLYAPDADEYIKNDRELLIDYYSLPFPVAKSNESLMDNIQYFDNDKYVKNVKEFLDRFGVHEDGRASERAAEFISELLSDKVDCEE